MYNPLSALSPLDGRYNNSVKELGTYFSEAALMRYRIYVEVEYLIALSHEKKIEDLVSLTKNQQNNHQQINHVYYVGATGVLKAAPAYMYHQI